MRFGHKLWVVIAVVVGLAASARWTLRAQERGNRAGRPRPEAAARPAPASVQDALIQPFDFPFAEPIALVDACTAIGRALNVAVAIDQAALDRQEIGDDEAVKLDLKGVRLKVGLKLLLDPLRLTYRVVPEDNLLIVTDAEGSEDPAAQALVELKAMHKEIHDLQDAVDDLRSLVEEELGFGPEEEGDGTSFVSHRAPRRPQPLRRPARSGSAPNRDPRPHRDAATPGR
ncbi:hypothetical protein TA3x_000812 [Tundrisphaera sp. TA3]|uniref:hypothetical protein n=1 Tax=Tundrisphaera sp. TA3 TaxID=3435775 RepID=UPI003EB8C94F